MSDSLNRYLTEAARTELPSSEDEADIEDVDTCGAAELQAQFNFHYTQDEASLSLKRDYVLGLCADSGYTRLAAGLSNTQVKVYDLNEAGALQVVQEDRVPLVPSSLANDVTICGVRFMEDNPYNLLVGTTNGLVRLFDLRASGEQGKFQYDGAGEHENTLPPVPKSNTCFDRNANSRIICCGTEQHMGNVYLIFFDIRERKQLGVYQDSHEDDITSVSFHPTNPDILCSGGTDGLINCFDIKKTEEDEALSNTINTESSVHRLNWHHNVDGQDIISCVTHTNDFKSFEYEEGDEFISFERSIITAGIRRKNAGNFNLINAHNLEDGGIFLLAGTNLNRGEILRSVSVPDKETLKPLTNFVGNKQIVRESIYDPKRNMLITGGESGIISIWTPEAKTESNKMKSKSKTPKSHKKTPY